MKMPKADYRILECFIRGIQMHHKDNPKARLVSYRADGLSAKRWRWDLLWATSLKIGDSVGMTGCHFNWYDTMNDDHIDTALRKITKTA